MDNSRELRQLLPADDEATLERRAAGTKVREQTRKSAEDTKERIRAAFTKSGKIKATLRPQSDERRAS
ncbi:hypothetical protein ACVMIX_002872 [Rhizobium leguminosarum]